MTAASTGTQAHYRAEASVLAEPAGHRSAPAGPVWKSGRGAVLTDLDGREHIDLGSGTLTQSVGHCHPRVVSAVRQQAGELENVHDEPTPARLRAAKALLRMVPSYLKRVAFFSTGAEVVEAALRIVHASVDPRRKRVIALRRGFHGKTRGSRSLVAWDVGGEPASAASLGYAAYCYRCPFGLRYPSCDLLCARLTVSQSLARPDVAALVAEPIQGAAGVIVPPPGYWEILAEACARHGVLLVADEVLTGGGRTGTFLAAERFGIEPDLVTVAKGIGSGYPVAAVLGRAGILTPAAVAAAGGSSTSFGGNAVGLSAASATLDVLRQDGLLHRVRSLAEILAEQLAPIAGRPGVGEIRQAGLLAGIEFVADRDSRNPAPALAAAVARRAAQLGVRTLPGSHVMRIAPPFVIAPDTLREGVSRLARAVAEMTAGGR
jgi:4-aminobutyrate aminotransferase-like enzyme